MILRTFLRLFRSIYFVLFFVAAVLGGAFWYFGPLIGSDEWRPFAAVIPRVVVVAVIAVIFLTAMLIVFLMRRRHDDDMAEEIVEAIDPGEAMITAEIDELRTKFKTAMTELRRSKGGRKTLNELPWYVIIGPPGAGKTTAIVNSGLQFPLADKIGKEAIGGVGGTRNCDWWFTNEAVLIDTAGRYTTQESNADADNRTWLGFLRLLKKYRPRQPVNGAIVAISLSDLYMQDELTQKAHAQAVRRRLHELRDQLGVRFPVYVLFTKADLIAGFAEYYDILGKEEREQVWGFTLPLSVAKSEDGAMGLFDQEFARLLGQLNAQLLERMQQERDPQRRALVAGFPGQVASMRGVARSFLEEVFQDNRFETRQMMRGVYFTSGTQEGTPIDRLMLSMAQTFGIGRQAIGSGQGTGRSYFLTRVFDGVMFPEAGLVSADDKVERRYRWARIAAMTATVAIALTTGALWVRSYVGNVALIDQAGAHVAAYSAAAATLPGSPVGDSDLPPVVEALNQLRDLPGNPAVNTPEPDRALTYGLYRGEIVGTQAAQTYRAALNQRLLPRLLLRLEEQMTANMNNPDRLYEALKIYLMLGLQGGRVNADLVTQWMTEDWDLAYRGPARAQLRADLGDHLQALLSQPMQEIALNGPLVEQVQSVLTELPLAQRVYNGIIASETATSLPEWRVTEIGGPAVSRAMVRSSGKPLNEGIEGIFTYDGFYDVFLPEAVSVAQRVQSEAWVLGEQGGLLENENALLALSRDVLDLYYNDFIARYDSLLSDLDIIPMESLSHAVEVTNVLSGPTSPIVNILTEISRETKLTEDRSAVDTEAVDAGVDRILSIESQANLSAQGQIILGVLMESATSPNGAPVPPPGAYVQDRFGWLHQMVDRVDGQPSQLDRLMTILTEVYQELQKMSFSGVTTGTQTGEAIQAFQQMAARMEGPVPRWATQIVTGSSGIAADGTRASMNALWQANVLPFCQQALTDRYPFNRRARADVAMQDFSRLFAPNGMIDAFFNENLLKYVDIRSRPWTWKKVNDVDLGISQQVLDQFQNASEIRDAFFNGNPTPLVQFQITPEALDPKANSVTLSIDGQNVGFSQRSGQPPPTAVTWPGAVGAARVTFEPQRNAIESVLDRSGPWGWFRLLDAAEVRRTNVSDRKRVIFNVGGRIAIFQLQSGSVLNPFALPALGKFSCPKSL